MNLHEREKLVRDNLCRLQNIFDSIAQLCPLNDDLTTILSNGAVLFDELQTHIHEMFLLIKLVPKPSIPSLLDPNQLSDWKLKGEGNFGRVYECSLQGARVAVKILKERARSSFLECHLLRELHHDNIVAFREMGVVSDAHLAKCISTGRTASTGPTSYCHFPSQSSMDSGVCMASPVADSSSEHLPHCSDSDVDVETRAYPEVHGTRRVVTDSSNCDARGYVDESSAQTYEPPVTKMQTFNYQLTNVQNLDPVNSQEGKGHVSSSELNTEKILSQGLGADNDPLNLRDTKGYVSSCESVAKHTQQGHFGVDKDPLHLRQQTKGYISSSEFVTKQMQSGEFGAVRTSLSVSEPKAHTGYVPPGSVPLPQTQKKRIDQKRGSLLHHVITNQGISMFIVMEYIDLNLLGYLCMLRNPLSHARAWDISCQIFNAIAYLHSKDVVHRDLKPDNILVEVGPAKLRAKVADFGLAWGCGVEKLVTSSLCNYGLQEGPRRGYVHVRWGAPEFVYNSEFGNVTSLLDYKRGDIYSFGLVTCFAMTGEKAMAHLSTRQLISYVQRGRGVEKARVKCDKEQAVDDNQCNSKSYNTGQLNGEFVPLPGDLSGPLLGVIESCLKNCPSQRPTAEELHSKYFSLKKNPYENDITNADFFCFGFLENTQVFVADSFCSGSDGFYTTGVRNTGYDHTQLRCEIDNVDIQELNVPDLLCVEQRDLYHRTAEKYKLLAARKEIDNNILAALKKLTISRDGPNEDQVIELHFQETRYCHHRTMRDMWMLLSDKDKAKTVPCKSIVNPLYSNSFGIHVAVLTNEGPERSQKFVFAQRSRSSSVATPGAITCGVVEGVSFLDKCLRNGQYYIDLVNTAERGLMEEIGLELTGSELDAICLTTVYLKFDFYEWGICGFVDLKDERIAKKHRLSAQNIKSRFTSGPKDKFEHQTLTFVDFQLDDMIKFVSQNHENFASSAKLVVVKVLEAFFGREQVDRAFHNGIE